MTVSSTRRALLLGSVGIAVDVLCEAAAVGEPIRDFVAWGDSLTAGPYPALAAAMFHPKRDVLDRGAGGQGAISIAIRQGALPLKLTVAGNEIPAWEPGNSVAIAPEVAIAEKNNNVLFYGGHFSGTLEGSLAGCEGTILTDEKGRWRFRRRQLGPAFAVGPREIFVIAETMALRTRIQWIWIGHNDVSNPTAVTLVPDVVEAMVRFAGHNRFLVGSILNAVDQSVGSEVYQRILTINQQLSDLFGRRFVDIRGELLRAADKRVDLDNLISDVVPGSLRTDRIHLNIAGMRIVAKSFVDRSCEMDW